MACGIESVWNNRFLRPPPVISLPAPLMQQGMKYSFMISQTSMHKRLTYLYFVNSWKILHNAIGQQLKTISQSVMSMSVMTGYHLLGIFLSTSCIERQTFGMQEQYILESQLLISTCKIIIFTRKLPNLFLFFFFQKSDFNM